MVETHGGGVHYVPDLSEKLTSEQSSKLQIFRSLEDGNKKLVLPFGSSDRALPYTTPYTTTADDLPSVKKKLLELDSFAEGLPRAFPTDDGLLRQEDLSKVKLYHPLIPDAASAKHQPDETTLKALADAMLDDSDPTSNIPAAYTYFGQFLAHDMTHMKEGKNCKGQTVWFNARKRALEFDTLFGTVEREGTPSSDWICEAGASLGQDGGIPPELTQTFDLPRNTPVGLPCCVDPRADTNLALAQMHVLLVRFHQKLAKSLKLETEDAKLETKLHLQAVALTDFLPKIIPCDIYNSVMQGGRRIVANNSDDCFLIPLEFATAVFRFGHSMVRRIYSPWYLNWPPKSEPSVSERPADLSTLLGFTHLGTLPQALVRFHWAQLWMHKVGVALPGFEKRQISARPISTQISKELGQVDKRHFPESNSPNEEFNLAFETLRRGRCFALPSGQELARLVGGTPVLDVRKFLLNHRKFKCLAVEGMLHEHTPLWFYTLAEAENAKQGQLGPMAARLVMETFHAAMLSDKDGVLELSDNGVTKNRFKRRVRIGSGPENSFSLSDVALFVYGTDN